MKNSMRHGLGVLLLTAVMAATAAPGAAAMIEVPGTSWLLGGASRLKVKKFGKFQQGTPGSLAFKTDGRFNLVLQDLFTLAGVYECGARKCLLTPDPDSLQNALTSLMEVSVFEFAFRGLQQQKVKFKAKFRLKRGTEMLKVRLKINFKSLLALEVDNPDDPDAELIEPFKMKFNFNGLGVSE